jgi:methionyl-tRNA formyltransferase
MFPWPTAFTYFHRTGKTPQRLIVWKARAAKILSSTSLQPGYLFQTSGKPPGLFVQAGETYVEDFATVEILELQPGGKRRMKASEFLLGHPVQSGDFLSSVSEQIKS